MTTAAYRLEAQVAALAREHDRQRKRADRAERRLDHLASGKLSTRRLRRCGFCGQATFSTVDACSQHHDLVVLGRRNGEAA